jgi:hypothetical protein
MGATTISNDLNMKKTEINANESTKSKPDVVLGKILQDMSINVSNMKYVREVL